MKNRILSRRDFLKFLSASILTGTGLLVLKGLFRYFNAQIDPLPQTEFDIGPVSNFPLGSRTVIQEIPAIILNSQDKISAISLVCTHLGCTVESKPEGFSCPCHGSRFDLQGNVIRGPANKPLRQLRIEITANNTLIIYTN
jgi:cytochrome b6-f complex iron-sulfur subunit